MAQPQDPMAAMIAARYTPLVLPQPLNALPGRDYHKYFPKFDAQGEVTAEMHWEAFVAFTDDHNYEHTDVWMRLFVQSLAGEVRTWFRGLPPNSIDGIATLKEVFLRHWGDTKDFLYYQT